jgi:hypothetical protein
MDGLSPDKSTFASPLVVKEAVLIDPGAAMIFSRAVVKAGGETGSGLIL